MHQKFRRPVVRLLIGFALIIWAGAAAVSSQGSSVWGAKYFPNIQLTTHEGQSVRFFDDLIKDKVVIINFIFTSCPDVCPLETARLREVQKILGDRVGRDVFMYSISIDPETDTPEVLKRYAERFHAGPGWLFLTGDKDEITFLRKKLGLYREEEEADGKLSAHTVSLMIGNQKTGRWMKRSPFENPYVLATQVGSWLHNWKLPPKTGQDYASAPDLRSISTGESLFRTRCASCHTIGADDAEQAARPQIGPDLFGVTRNRDRAWLVRFLREPDKMLAEEDPLAMALKAQYKDVAMPNLSLGDQDIRNLIAHIEAETERVELERAVSGDHHHDGGHHHPGGGHHQ